MGPEKLCLLLLFGWPAGSKPSDLCNLKSQQRGVTSSRLGGQSSDDFCSFGLCTLSSDLFSHPSCETISDW